MHHEMLWGVLHLKGATRGDKVQTKTPWMPMSPSVTGRQPREFLRHGDMSE
jgi:hypothetical protein